MIINRVVIGYRRGALDTTSTSSMHPCDSLREAHKLRISRKTISADTVGLESVLHIDLPCLVEIHSPLLHDSQNLSLGCIVEAGARIARLDVFRQIKVATGQTSLDIASEAIGKSRVNVVGAWESRSHMLEARDPVGTGEEENRAEDDGKE